MPASRPHQAKAADWRSNRRSRTLSSSPREPGEFLVVAIGASAGGLDACRKLVGALPASNGMAFILVQHLDPTHESMMVDLLTGHTSMQVSQATDGMPLERDHLYVIPPGTYLSVVNGSLHLSQPQARHGARLPFDFLLHSVAEECGARAICVILSGTGSDGSLGLKAVKDKGGLVIAQNPGEASYDGMPRSAMLTGSGGPRASGGRNPEGAGQIQPPDELGTRTKRIAAAGCGARVAAPTSSISCGRRPRTISRSTSREPCSAVSNDAMAMAAIETDDMDRYLGLLRSDTNELNLLAKDLLINVTSFFRDPKVFDFLATKIIPELVRRPATGSTDPHLDSRVQHGRGNVFARHGLS